MSAGFGGLTTGQKLSSLVDEGLAEVLVKHKKSKSFLLALRGSMSSLTVMIYKVQWGN